MATYKAISAGDATTLAIWQVWNGSAWVGASVLPSSADDVYTNNNIVTVTTSLSYASWNRSSVAAPLSITQGGQFQITGANDITTQGIIKGGNNNYINPSAIGACVIRTFSHTGKYIHIGEVKTFDVVNTARNIGLWNESTYDIDIIGNQESGSIFSHAIYNNGNCLLRVFGNQLGGITRANVDCHTIFIATACNVEIYGNQKGGEVVSATAYPYGCNAIRVNAGGVTVRIFGNATASGVPAIVNLDTTSTIIYEGNVYNNLSMVAIFSIQLFYKVTQSTMWEFNDFDGNIQTLYGAGALTGHPVPADVRDGVTYANGSLTGTLEVEEFLALPIALKERLERVATTEEVATIWAD